MGVVVLKVLLLELPKVLKVVLLVLLVGVGRGRGMGLGSFASTLASEARNV